MPYLVHSRGRPVGTTRLEYVAAGGPFRSGTFVPNDDGERDVVPAVDALHRALHAYREHRRARGFARDQADPEPFTPLEEALEAVAALDLTLHDADGSTVPTTSVGIQNCELMCSLYEDDPGDDYPPLSPEEEAAIQREVDEMIAEWEEEHAPEPWQAEAPEPPPGLEPPPFPRLQVHVVLESGAWIP